jgi:hypothetical protein
MPAPGSVGRTAAAGGAAAAASGGNACGMGATGLSRGALATVDLGPAAHPANNATVRKSLERSIEEKA